MGPEDKKVSVSVIIPCRNEVKHIETCISSVLANSSGNRVIEVLIVEGKSNDGTKELINSLVQKNHFVKLIDNPSGLTPVAFNLGIKNARGTYIVIAGARTLLAENYIDTCISILESDVKIACVGGKVQNVFENETAEIIAGAMGSSFGVGGGNFRVKQSDGSTDTVGTPVYRKSIFDEIGLFDEDLVRNQDDELNFRLTQRGYKIWFSVKTSMRYFVRATYKNLFRQYFQYGYWKVFVNRKHRAVTTVRQLVPALFVIFIAAGPLTCLSNRYAVYAWLALFFMYIILAVVSAVRVARKASFIAAIVYTFVILHLSYGLGYLQGIGHFLLLGRKKASVANKQLSR